ncbi:hypothetical protein, partial [Paraburkholderia sp. SIMBA_053]|uniref:hypothetical protein n=1 Tax=Paraburkholderia sp. SIMBA_053 TaxID=3085794 RepID=UPI00397D443B
QSRLPDKKKQREFTQTDIEHVIVDLAQQRQIKPQPVNLAGGLQGPSKQTSAPCPFTTDPSTLRDQ